MKVRKSVTCSRLWGTQFTTYLERNYELGPPLSGQINITKLSSTKRLSDFKVFEGPLLGYVLCE